jgi:EAL domain-containing protein (putative c-di-GMP-specific phosphodiesterase class I)/GGDEF domain-containing protein
MFKQLRTKLAVAFGGTLGLIMTLMAISVYVLVDQNARQKVEDELNATTAVFNRLWEINEQQLAENAAVMARDFGFREAVSTNDLGTMESALANLKERLELDRAFFVSVDGEAVEAGRLDFLTTPENILQVLEDQEMPSGILEISDTSYQAVSAPVLAPTLTGWLILATRVDETQLSSLEQLSAIPVDAYIVSTMVPTGDEKTHIIAKTPLGKFDGSANTELVLQYPISKAMAPYQSLLWAIILLAVFGISLLLACSILLARNVTSNITQLDKAMQNLAFGKPVQLNINSGDEIGRLADNFSAMAEEIALREKRITKLSMTDTETEIPNRRAIEAKMRQLREKTSTDIVFGVAVRIERFAKIRSVIGYSATNALVTTLAERFGETSAIRGIGRLASDVLGIAIVAASTEEAHTLLEQLETEMSRPVKVRNELVDVQLQLGYASLQKNTPGKCLDQAGIALEQLKNTSQCKVALFDIEKYGNPSGTLSLMSDMIKALGSDEIYLTYQPKLNLLSGKIDSAEALIRWEHATRGFISPDDFIVYAEETGHIRELTNWVIKRALKDQQKLEKAGHALRISINFSGRLLGDDDFIDEVLALVRSCAETLCFEITETAVIDDPERALVNIEKMRNAGLLISIDDYGSGLSSLSYLKQIPAHELKIDKEFVMQLQAQSSDALLIKSTIDLAHGLGMKIVAEGVETGEQLQLLQLMGADVAQGYHISRPLRLDAFEDMMSKDAPTVSVDSVVQTQKQA